MPPDGGPGDHAARVIPGGLLILVGAAALRVQRLVWRPPA
jgi:hypothetical protein